MANGNGTAVRPAAQPAQDQENIFLFYPNLIGTQPRLAPLRRR